MLSWPVAVGKLTSPGLRPPHRLVFLSPSFERSNEHQGAESSQSSTTSPPIAPSFNAASWVTNVASCSVAVHAIIRSKSLFFRPLRLSCARSAAYRRTTAKPSGSIGKVSVIRLIRARFCSLRADFSAPKSNSACTNGGMPTSPRFAPACVAPNAPKVAPSLPTSAALPEFAGQDTAAARQEPPSA
jgi:hypothetical protein